MAAMPEPGLEPNADTIGAALEMLVPAGNLLLVAIDPLKTRNNVVGRTFAMPGALGVATDWAVDQNLQGWNVYWTPNEARPLDGKSQKPDMLRARYFWADCDPDVFKFKGYSEARQQLLDEVLPSLSATASFVIDSGHGLQAFWRIDVAPVVESPGQAGAFEEINKRLGAMFGSKGTHNVDRVMRVPGTVNFVGASKISKGYPNAPTMSRLLHATGAVWSVSQIDAWAGKQELQRRLAETLRTHRAIGLRWEGGTEGLQDASGSSRDQSMVTMLALAGWQPEDIRAVLEHWPHGSVGGREQGDRYWDRMFGNAANTVAERDRANSVRINFGGADQAGQTAPNRTSALPLEYASELDASALTIPQIIEDWVTAGGLSVVYGESNSGKTYMVIDMACAVARGASWLGKRTVQGAVLYVAGEGAASVRMRLLAYMRHHRITDLPVAIVPVAVNLLDPAGDTHRVIEAVQTAEAHLGVPVSLIVIDTLARAMGGGNENASEDMGSVVSHADLIRQSTSAHLAFIHHSGKDATKGARGSSVLRAAVDTEVEVVADETAKTHTATFTKQRDLASKGDSVVTRFQALEFGVDQWGKPQRVCIVEQVDPATEPVITALTGHQKLFLSVARDGERFDVVRTAFYRALPDGTAPDARQKAFVRVSKWARLTGRIDVRNEILHRLDDMDSDEGGRT